MDLVRELVTACFVFICCLALSTPKLDAKIGLQTTHRQTFFLDIKTFEDKFLKKILGGKNCEQRSFLTKIFIGSFFSAKASFGQNFVKQNLLDKNLFLDKSYLTKLFWSIFLGTAFFQIKIFSGTYFLCNKFFL